MRRGEAVPLGLVTARSGGGRCAAVGPRRVITAEIENNVVNSLFDRVIEVYAFVEIAK